MIETAAVHRKIRGQLVADLRDECAGSALGMPEIGLDHLTVPAITNLTSVPTNQFQTVVIGYQFICF